MSGRPITKGSTDQSTVIRIVDSSDGTPETAVTSATSGLDLKYRREGATATSITESDLSALNDAHSDGGMLHIGAGYYRLDLPDAAVASGANGVLVYGTVTGMVVIGTYHPLTNLDVYDGVRAGLTALPNAAADGAGGLPISDAGGLDLDAKIGALTYGTANRVNVQVYGIEASAITATSIATDAITAAKIADGAIDAATFAAGAITATVIADGAIDAAAFAAGAITATVIATDAIDADALATDAVTEISNGVVVPAAAAIADAVWDEATSGHTTSGTFGEQCKTDVDAILAFGAPPSANTVADAVLNRAASNIESTADKHSLGALVMIGTNSSISGSTLTAKKPSDDSTFQTYTITTSSSADPITGVS